MHPFVSFISYVYPLSCVFIPCIIYQIIQSKKGVGRDAHFKTKLIWRYIMLLYIYMVMSVVGLSSIWEIGKYGDIIRWEDINLIPFSSEGASTYILNAFMFTPFGFLLPLIWERYRRVPKIILCSFVFSLLIELGQLFNRRVTDVDDLMMNVLGAVIGYFIWVIFDKLFRGRVKSKDISSLDDKPYIYVILSIGCTFLLYNWWWLIPLYERFQ